MSGRRFRRISGGVCSLGLHLVWCARYRRRIVGGRVAARCGERLEQIAAEHEFPCLRQFATVLRSPSYVVAFVGYVSESTVRRYIEHHWDAVVS